jgi:flagellar biosynthesis/type III secretory pathway chaperone
MYNPSLREEPREQLAEVIPLKQETSLLDWLETNNRLIARESHEDDLYDDDEEISDLMGSDNDQYDDDDTDDLLEDE